MSNYIYNRRFYGNIVIVRRTGCGKTHFMQKLAVNNFFGNLKKVEWVSHLKLDKSREVEIQFSFDCKVEFHYPKNKEYFENLLEQLKLHIQSDKTLTKDTNSVDFINDVYGENKERERLIIMDNASALADTSQFFKSC